MRPLESHQIAAQNVSNLPFPKGTEMDGWHQKLLEGETGYKSHHTNAVGLRAVSLDNGGL